MGWNVVENLVAVSAALASGSIALLGFGVKRLVETASGTILKHGRSAPAAARPSG